METPWKIMLPATERNKIRMSSIFWVSKGRLWEDPWNSVGFAYDGRDSMDQSTTVGRWMEKGKCRTIWNLNQRRRGYKGLAFWVIARHLGGYVWGTEEWITFSILNTEKKLLLNPRCQGLTTLLINSLCFRLHPKCVWKYFTEFQKKGRKKTFSMECQNTQSSCDGTWT